MRPWYLPAVLSVRRLTRSASIIHAHDSHAAALSAIARLGGQRAASVCHRRVAFPIDGPLARRWKYRHVDLWIAVSSEIAELLRDAGASSYRVVPSALDAEDFRSRAATAQLEALRSELEIPRGAPVIVVVAAVVEQKGHEVLIWAAPTVLATHPDAIFLCAGEGPLRGRLERVATKAGVRESFRFPGFRTDVAALLRLASVAALPSVGGEGSNAVLKETMAVGCPIVATDLPGNREVIGDAGTLVAVGDAAALGSALLIALQSSARSVERAHRMETAVARFRPEVMVEEMCSAYRSLLRKAPAAVA
jgi:glycosyltransferase involved in cell wall biosynthesis